MKEIIKTATLFLFIVIGIPFLIGFSLAKLMKKEINKEIDKRIEIYMESKLQKTGN